MATLDLIPEPNDEGILLDTERGSIQIYRAVDLHSPRGVDHLSQLVTGRKAAIEMMLEQGALGLETLKTSAHIAKLDEKIIELTSRINHDVGEQVRIGGETAADKNEKALAGFKEDLRKLLDERQALTFKLVDERNVATTKIVEERTALALKLQEEMRQETFKRIETMLSDPELGVVGAAKKEILDQIAKAQESLKEAITARQTELLRGSFTKGDAFEDVVAARLPVLARAMGASVTYVGKTPGVKNVDAGDYVMEVPTAAAHVTIVFEAKDIATSKSPEAIRKDLRAAMANREANAAVFIARSATILPKCMGFGQVEDCSFYCAFDPAVGDDAVLATTIYLAKVAAWERVRPTDDDGIDVSVLVEQVEVLRDLTESFAKIEASVSKAVRENDNIRQVATRIRDDMLKALRRLSEALGE